MKTILALTLCSCFFFTKVLAQNVGINTSTPHPSSELEIKSTSKGFLAPRMTKTQKDAIVAPAVGLLVYQTDSVPGFYNYDGIAWTRTEGAPPIFKAFGNRLSYSIM